MKQKFLLKTMLLLCALIVGGVNSAWGEDKTDVLTASLFAATSTTYTVFSNVSVTNGSSAVYAGNSAKTSNGGIQLRSKSSNSGIVSTTSGGDRIKSVSITVESGSNTVDIYGSNTAYTDASDLYNSSTQGTKLGSLSATGIVTVTGNYKYFGLRSSNGAIYLTNITIVWETSPTTYTVTYDANGGSGTMTDSNSPYAAGATVTLLSNTFTAPSGKEFSSWAVTDASSNPVTVTSNQFTMPASNVTVTAQWQDAATSDYINVSPTITNVVTAGDDESFTITTDQTLDADPTQFYTTADGDVTTTKPAWITEALYDESTLLVSVAPNTGAARTAYFRVEKGTVKSSVITINQAAATYTIEQYTTPVTAHGTITFSPSSPVATGAEVTLTATPAEGYAFTADSWVFYKESGEDIVTDNSITVTDGKITMPAYNLYVDATFAPVAVTGVTLDKNTASIAVGDTETLTATVAPFNALNKAVTWTSSNTSVATVVDGVVTGVAVGSATIAVTTDDGSYTATCTVTVENAITFDASTDTGTSLNKNGVSFTTSATESSVFKFYKNSTTTFGTTAGKITRIEFTGVSGYAISNMTAGTGTLTTDGNDGVWTGKVTSVTFTASAAQARASKIKVFVATTATPTFSVDGGEYDEAKSVTISCATDGATIYYTTDGTDPDEDSDEYTSAISITETTTLKAIAIKDEVESAVASATYTMNRPDAPTFDVAEGIFNAAFTLHLSAADGATIYYTTNGDTPTSSSTEYSDGISIPAATKTVKAIAVKSGLTSDVAKVTYTYDTRPAPTFTLSATELDLKVNETSSAVSLTTNSDGEVTFSCDNAAVTLTGTGNSRTISANAAGEYTVNVATAATGNYLAGAGTITVTVTKKKTTMVLTPTFTSKDLYVTNAGSLTGVPQYNSADVAGAEVTYTSSNTSVATIASDGAVTFNKAGTTTLTASYAGNDEYEECEATYELTLIDTTPQETEVNITLNNTFFGCTSFTNWQTGMDTSLSGESNNVRVTYRKGTSANMYCNSEKVRFYTDNTFTIEAPVGYHIISVDMNATIISADPEGTISSDTWTGDAASVSFTFANKTDLTSISVTLAPTVTVTASGYLSYCSPHKLDFSQTVVKAYKASVNNTTATVRLTQVDVVPAGAGVVLFSSEAKAAAEAKTYSIPVTVEEASDVTGNEMVGVLERTQVFWNPSVGVYNYILQQGQFYKATESGGYLKANRAYLSTSYDVSAGSNPSSRMAIVFNDETTGIKSMNNGQWTIYNAVYDLQGRRVETPRKGSLYIVNGKKVVF